MSYRGGLSASFLGATPAGQRLGPLNLFARLLIEGCVAEVDVPVQARVRVVLVVECCVEGIAGWRYSLLLSAHQRAPFLQLQLRQSGWMFVMS
jgi:hypothetical protein